MDAVTEMFRVTTSPPEDDEFPEKVNNALLGEDRLLLLKQKTLSEDTDDKWGTTRYINLGPVDGIGPLGYDLNAEMGRQMRLMALSKLDLPNNHTKSLTPEELDGLVGTEKLFKLITVNPAESFRKLARRNQAIADLLDTQPEEILRATLQSALADVGDAFEDEDRQPRQTRSIGHTKSAGGSIASGANNGADDADSKDSTPVTEDESMDRVIKRKRAAIVAQHDREQKSAKTSHLKAGFNMAGLSFDINDPLPMGGVKSGNSN